MADNHLASDNRHNMAISFPEEFSDVVRWILRSKIAYAITWNEAVYRDLIEEFWINAEYKVHSVTKKPHVSSFVRGKEVLIYEVTVRNTLQLDDDRRDPRDINEEEARNKFVQELGYEGPFRKNEIQKRFLSRDWKIIMKWTPMFDNMYWEERFPTIKAALKAVKEKKAEKEKIAEKKRKVEKEKEPPIDDDEITRKRKDEGKAIDLDAGKKKKQWSKGDGEGFMKSARDSYVRQQRSPSRLKTPPPRGITDEDIEAYLLAHAALDAERHPPSRQTEGTSGIRHSPPKTQQDPPAGTPIRLKSMAKKKSRPIGNLLLRWMKGKIEALKSREDDTDCEIEDLKATIKKLNFQLDYQTSLNKKMQTNMNDMGKALLMLKRGSRSLTMEVNRLRERLNEDPLIFDDVFDSSIFNDAVIFDLDQDEKEEEKHEKPTDLEPCTELLKKRNDDESHNDILGTGGTSSTTPSTQTTGDEGNNDGNTAGVSDPPKSGVAEDDVMIDNVEEEMPEVFMEEGEEEMTNYETPIPRPLHQNIEVLQRASDRKIISWAFNGLKHLFVIKRRMGEILYFHNEHDLLTLPTWDIYALEKLNMLNHGNHSEGTNVEKLIISVCHKRFPMFKPQQPKKRISKKEVDPATKLPKTFMYVQPAKVVNRVTFPPERETCLHHFIKWYYDNLTREAVICRNGTPSNDICVLDPMDMFSFSILDLETLFKSNIRSNVIFLCRHRSVGIKEENG
ncbi:hypothetical protein L1987_13513 [Smallanthus sonchifolius]|uniref:Uncharacterized protein n=1 Tax=Smallanthus sonchifolius TaxID=185202 RepID=A0ACB9JH40_9ASTR|nr:hypothetical protein L1987_13513 [Smallanthus sonchifolius]